MKTKSIITALFNRRQDEIDAFEHLYLDSLLKHADGNTQLILVDDCSPLRKETTQLLEKWKTDLEAKLGDVQILYNEENKGYAGSNNRGIEASDGSTIFLINPDIRLTNGALDSMADKLYRDESYGAIGPLSTNPADGSQRVMFKALNSYSEEEIKRIDDFAEKIRKSVPDQEKQANLITFFCCGLKKEVIKDVGPIDERFYPLFWEDLDYVVRIKKKGYKLMVDPQTFIYHGRLNNFNISYMLSHHLNWPFFKNMGKFLFKQGPAHLLKEYGRWATGLLTSSKNKYIK